MPRKGSPPRLRFPAGEVFDKVLSKSAFARLIKCDPARITQMIKAGTIVPPALTVSGDIVPTLAVAQLEAAGCSAPRDPAAEAVKAITANPDAPKITYDQARTATEVLKAHVALLDLRTRREELIEAEMADGVLFDCMRAVRDAWQVWPARVVAEMATRLKVDPAVLLTELERGVRTQLGSTRLGSTPSCAACAILASCR